ncbi:MAG: hypothetical protein ACUVXA_15040, partial [Candidatus Jordarchaeum sp.]|uniref:hypothetical protein n=1 Tax=Candidatus Jordarchaeum sp. TaxID=2823881 RepID=UPI00404963D2
MEVYKAYKRILLISFLIWLLWATFFFTYAWMAIPTIFRIPLGVLPLFFNTPLGLGYPNYFGLS